MSKNSERETIQRTPVDLKTVRSWYESCEPGEPLKPADPKYYNLSQPIGDEGVLLRGNSSTESLRDPIELRDESCQLFSGFRGTGKSTELRRLALRLEEDGYSVLMIDARDYHTLNRELVIEDMLVLFSGAFAEATGERLGKTVVVEGYWKRLAAFLKKEIDFGDVQLPAGFAKFKVGINHDAPFWLEVRKAMKLTMKELKEQSHDYIKHCVDLIRHEESTRHGVVFIVDNLELLNPSFGEFQEVMTSVTDLFSQWAEYLRFPNCHVIYTVPPYVQLISTRLKNCYDGHALVLPAIKVTVPGIPLRPYKPGIQALRELLACRIPVDVIFGETPDLLEELIVSSGGHIRTLISFTQDLMMVIKNVGLPISWQDLERVISPFRQSAKFHMGRDGAMLLNIVQRKGDLEDVPKEDHAKLAGLMDEALVLCYLNGENRYEAHPLIREHVQKKAEEIRNETTS